MVATCFEILLIVTNFLANTTRTYVQPEDFVREKFWVSEVKVSPIFLQIAIFQILEIMFYNNISKVYLLF